MTLQLKLRPGLVQKPILDHRLILTPRMQQAIKLVQFSRLELIETVGQEMEENPVLEDLVTGEAEERIVMSKMNLRRVPLISQR